MINNYTISNNLTNLTNGNITLTLVATNDYQLPKSIQDITVTNGQKISYNNITGVLVIAGDNTTTVSVACESNAYEYIFNDGILTISKAPYEQFDTMLRIK